MTDYTKTGNPPQDGRGISKQIRDEFSLIETAVNSKANIDSPTFTGTPAAPTAALGTNTTQLATTAFVAGTAFSSALPAQTGNSGKLITTDGTNASWTGDVKASVFRLVNVTDPTKKLAIDVGGISTATTRTWTAEDNNVVVGTPGIKLVGVTNASASATVDIETTFDNTYDAYLVIASNVVVQTDGVNLMCRLKIGGSYLTTNTYDYTYDATTVGASSYTLTGSTAQSAIILSQTLGNAAAEHANFKIWAYGVNQSSFYKTINFNGYSHLTTGAAQLINGIATNTTTGALTGIRIYASSGNISSGTFRVYGFRRTLPS